MHVMHILAFYAHNANLMGGVINTTKKIKQGSWSRNKCWEKYVMHLYFNRMHAKITI